MPRQRRKRHVAKKHVVAEALDLAQLDVESAIGQDDSAIGDNAISIDISAITQAAAAVKSASVVASHLQAQQNFTPIEQPTEYSAEQDSFSKEEIMTQNDEGQNNDNTQQGEAVQVALEETESAAPSHTVSINTGVQSQPQETIGTRLRIAREATGANLYDIGHEIFVKPEFLNYLEDDRYDLLPAPIYTLGFLRTYADWLGLDSAALLNEYRTGSVANRTAPTKLYMPQPVPEARMPSGLLVIAGIILATLIYGGWYYSRAADREGMQPPEAPVMQAEEVAKSAAPAEAETSTKIEPIKVQELKPEQAAAKPQDDVKPSAEAAPAEEAAKAESSDEEIPQVAHSVVIEASGKSWITLTNADGATVMRKLLEKGESYTLTPEKGLKISTTNAAATIVKIDGRAVPKLGNDGQVVRNILVEKLIAKAKP